MAEHTRQRGAYPCGLMGNTGGAPFVAGIVARGPRHWAEADTARNFFILLAAWKDGQAGRTADDCQWQKFHRR